MAFTIAFLITLTIVLTKAAFSDDCDICFQRNDCYIMNRFNVDQQELWMMKYQCQDPYTDPNGGEDFVCCSKIIQEIEYSMKSNPIVDYFGQNDSQSRHFNSAQGNGAFYPNMRSVYNQNLYDQRTFRPNKPQFNNNQLPQKPYFSNVFNNVPSGFGIGQYPGDQCVPTSFPPKPETGCCGREATDTERITGSHNINSIDDLENIFKNRIPNNKAYPPQSNALLKSINRRDLGRRKRAISEKTVNVTIDQRIAGGKETEFEQFPWTVLLRTTFDYGDRRESFNCGGALISSKYVLTAAHCVAEDNGTITDAEVYLAEYNKRTFPIDCKNILGVGEKCIENLIMYGENVIIHPEYDTKGLRNDIALIRLRNNAPYTDYIRPICMLPINIDSPEFSNLSLAVAGWGRTNGPYESHIKQSTVVNLVPQEECKKHYPSLSTNHLCAVGHTGEDTCKGDSGGPLMTVYGGKHFVVGVVSGKLKGHPCGTSVPSLYTNVYNYLDWILSNMKN